MFAVDISSSDLEKKISCGSSMLELNNKHDTLSLSYEYNVTEEKVQHAKRKRIPIFICYYKSEHTSLML